MKVLFVAASVAAISVAVPAFAQESTSPNTGVYGSVGYSNFGQSGVNLDAIEGKLGYRFNNYAGVEGELATGVGSDKTSTTLGDVKTKLRHQGAIYGVGFLPVSPKVDLIGRVGYGSTKVRTKVAGLSDSRSTESWNYGAGAQYHVDAKNGVRADYTRQSYLGDNGHADVWSVGYNRRF